MTTAAAMSQPGFIRTAQRLHLGPLAVIGVVAILDYLVIGPTQFVNGLTSGAIYALIAIGYTMVYGIIELINFAHGEVFMVGAFGALFVLTNILGQTGSSSDALQAALVLAITFAIVMVAVGFLGVVIDRVAYRPLRNAPRLAPLLTAIGVSFILQNIIQILYGPSPVRVPQVIAPTSRIPVGDITIGVVNVFVIVVTIVLIIVLQVFVNRTRLGRAMRSTAQDREAAALMGVNINRTIALTFLIGSALAGAAGIVQGQYFGSIRFDMGFQAGLKAFTAAVLGGIGSIPGAALGGFIIGFIEITMAALGLFEWRVAAVFGVLILILVFRPAGIFGTQLGERA